MDQTEDVTAEAAYKAIDHNPYVSSVDLALGDFRKVPDEQLERIMVLCDHDADAPSENCVACKAWVERMERGGLQKNTPIPQSHQDQPPVPEQSEADYLQVVDPKEAVLVRLGELEQAISNLYATGQTLGPVTSQELAVLVVAAQKYLGTVSSLEVGGVHTPSDEERQWLDELKKIVDRASGK